MRQAGIAAAAARAAWWQSDANPFEDWGGEGWARRGGGREGRGGCEGGWGGGWAERVAERCIVKRCSRSMEGRESEREWWEKGVGSRCESGMSVGMHPGLLQHPSLPSLAALCAREACLLHTGAMPAPSLR